MYSFLSRQNHPLVITSVLADRTLCRLLAGLMVVHLSWVKLGLPSWPCPVRHGLGIPCPGCGLSRAILHFCQGHWHQALLIHAFAPLALLFLLGVSAIAIFPTKFQNFWVKKLRKWEKRTGFGLFLSLALFSYWIIRLLYFRDILYQLVI